MSTNKKQQVASLCESAIMLALATALSFITIYRAPFGGAVTPASTLPLMILSYRRGLKWGVPTAFLFGAIQMAIGEVFAWGLTPVMLVGSILLDYLLAFTVLGFAGIFRKADEVGKKHWLLGVLLVSLVRFLSHFLSGVVLWANYAEFVAFGASWINHPILYSLCYNGAFMLPETALTFVISLLIPLDKIKKI